MDEMLQEWKGADQFIIVKGTWFEKWMCKLEVSHETLEEVITEYCNAIFNSGGELKAEE